MEYWELIHKYIKDEASALEREELEKWLTLNEANAVLFAEVKAIWEATGKLSEPLKINKSLAWQAIQTKIRLENNVVEPKIKKTIVITWVMRIAATLILILFTAKLFIPKNENLLTVKTGSTKKLIILSDCTKVFLNENSEFTYPETFEADERKVSLIGEAFFDVTKNPKKPFLIENKEFNVKVLGTSFNVLAYDKNENAVVTVVSGKVSFSDKAGNSATLIKDDVGILNKSKHQVLKTINTDLNFLAWKTKKIEFKNADFKEVCKTLTTYFSVQMDITNETIYKCKFTGYFVNPSLQDVLLVLEKILGLTTTVENKKIIVAGKGC
jgi:transmembrane sensor